MQAKETKVKDLIEGVKQYIVPLFQRSYCWQKEQWKNFYQDIFDLINNETKKTHFIGSIVTLCEEQNPAGVSKYLIIDGQQRITTILLLLIALRDSSKDELFSNEIEDTFLINKYKNGEDKQKLIPTNFDKTDYLNLITHENPNHGRKIVEAYNYFKNKINEDCKEKELKDALINRLSLVSIILSKEDNPYLVFETLNHSGKPLTQADLIRNYILMCIPSDKQEEYYKMYWNPMEEMFNEKLTEFIRHRLMIDGKILRQDEVYEKIKYSVSNENAIEHLKKLYKYSMLYNKIINPEKETENELKYYFDAFKKLDLSVTYHFILYFYGMYENGEIKKEKFIVLLKIIENYILRRIICEIPNSTLSKILSRILSKFNNEIIEEYEVELKNYLLNQNYPNDEKLVRRILEYDIYGNGLKEKRCKLILSKLELSYDHKERIDFSNLSIEHIMPQKLTDWWKEHLGTEYETIQKNYLHKLANLTLTSYNSELSNKNFNSKKEILIESHLELNKEFEKFENWREEDILRRNKEITSRILQILPYWGKKINHETDEVTGKKPCKVIILGGEYQVSSWRDVLVVFWSQFYELDENRFFEFAKMYPFYITEDKNKLRRAYKLAGRNGYYFETNFSAKSVVNLCNLLIEFYNYSKNDWSYILSDNGGK